MLCQPKFNRFFSHIRVDNSSYDLFLTTKNVDSFVDMWMKHRVLGIPVRAINPH